VPQVGGVRIGSDVEVGANAAIDCGAINHTVIGDGVRIDNLVHVAHNCHIGDHSALAAQVGMAGSVRIGKRCMFAGQVGINGHIEICDDVTFMGKCVVSKSVTEPGVYSGAFPAEESKSWSRRVASIRRLDKLQARVRELEKKSK
jgi:UDP-3-O-[3-hydroxymyristoyl] glucosamine N-acyltransferase